MLNNIKNELLAQTDSLLEYLGSLNLEPSTPFTEAEVQSIIAAETAQTQANYDRAVSQFQESNADSRSPQTRRFVVYWGYPGAGKSFMAQKLIDRFGREEDCLPFNIIDKDQHRDLFPNLFNHLKNGHLDECEKFAGITIDYVRRILDLSLLRGERSILSIGSMGAGSEFKDNAAKAIASGYKPCAVYMSVNPDIAYLSSVYRSADLYDKIIFQNKELYPRLVSDEYFSRVVKMLPDMIGRIDAFQRQNSRDVDLMVINRANEVLYDSRRPHELDVRAAIEREETRPLTDFELISVNKQLTRIRQSIQYRCDNRIYAPYKNEIEMASTAVSRIAELIKRQPENENRRKFANAGNSANGNNTSGNTAINASTGGNIAINANTGGNIAIKGAAARRAANDDAFLLPAARSRRTR